MPLDDPHLPVLPSQRTPFAAKWAAAVSILYADQLTHVHALGCTAGVQPKAPPVRPCTRHCAGCAARSRQHCADTSAGASSSCLRLYGARVSRHEPCGGGGPLGGHLRRRHHVRCPLPSTHAGRPPHRPLTTLNCDQEQHLFWLLVRDEARPRCLAAQQRYLPRLLRPRRTRLCGQPRAGRHATPDTVGARCCDAVPAVPPPWRTASVDIGDADQAGAARPDCGTERVSIPTVTPESQLFSPAQRVGHADQPPLATWRSAAYAWLFVPLLAAVYHAFHPGTARLAVKLPFFCNCVAHHKGVVASQAPPTCVSG